MKRKHRVCETELTRKLLMLVRSRVVSALKHRPYRTVSALSHLIATYIIPNPPATKHIHVQYEVYRKITSNTEVVPRRYKCQTMHVPAEIEGTMRTSFKIHRHQRCWFHFRIMQRHIGKCSANTQICHGHVNRKYIVIGSIWNYSPSYLSSVYKMN